MFPFSAVAQPAKPEAKPAAAKVDVGAAVKKIRSGDDGKIQAGLAEVRSAGTAGGGAAAAPAVAEVLSKGLSLASTEAAIETLGDLESEAGSTVLAQYALHRNNKVRRAAVKGLTRTKGSHAAAALKHALTDADPAVRSTAASGLGALKAKDAVADLLLALDHRVHEAAVSIGQLCTVDQCEQLAAKIGKLPFDIVTSGLDPILFRSAPDVTDDAKIKIIERLRDLKTNEANKFLRDVQKRWPATGSAKVKQSIEQAVIQTTGGSGAPPPPPPPPPPGEAQK